MENIIIYTPERFIGKHKNHRISIVFANDSFDMDIQDKTNMNIMEMHAYFENIEAAKDFAVEYINRITEK